MIDIRADVRHDSVLVIWDEPVTMRTVPGWLLVFARPSRFVDGHIRALYDHSDENERAAGARRLVKLIRELSQTPI